MNAVFDRTMHVVSAVAIGVAAAAASGQCDPEWSPLGTGVYFVPDGDGSFVGDLTVFDDGSGPALYAGGGFFTAGGVAANFIARWDGSAWSPLGAGMDNFVEALTVFDDGSGPALYAGGFFTTAGGVAANRIARWDGSDWSPLGSGLSNNFVRDLTVFDDGTGPALYAGGSFTTAGGVDAFGIAKWDGSVWSPLVGPSGQGMNFSVEALTVFDDGSGPALYAGGLFTTAGGITASRIARWDGSAWSPLGTGMNNTVYALTVFDDGTGPALYAGGEFFNAGGVLARQIARWAGSAWTPLGTGMLYDFGAATVWSLTTFDDGSGPALYAGGVFTSAGGVAANRIARWDGSAWSPLGTGIDELDSLVRSMTAFDDGSGPALYAGGGLFTAAGGVAAKNIARWGCESSPPCPADLVPPFGVLDLADINAFTIGFTSQNPIADLAPPFGVFDLADVGSFVGSFVAGCP